MIDVKEDGTAAAAATGKCRVLQINSTTKKCILCKDCTLAGANTLWEDDIWVDLNA